MKSGLRLGSSEVDELSNIQSQQWRILLPNTGFFCDVISFGQGSHEKMVHLPQ